MRKAMLIVGLVLLSAIMVVVFTSRPAVTLTVLALTNDSRVVEAFPGSNYQSVVAIVEMKNRSKREFMYTAYAQCPRLPLFRCLYREGGNWQMDDTLFTADMRGSVESTAAITGLPWGPHASSLRSR